MKIINYNMTGFEQLNARKLFEGKLTKLSQGTKPSLKIQTRRLNIKWLIVLTPLI